MNRTNVIERIHKLLALASEEGGGTESERNLAAQRAQELMIKHEVEQEDLLNVRGREALPGIEKRPLSNFAQKESWKGMLAAILGEQVGVDAIYLEVTDERAQKTKNYALVGRPESIEFVQLLHGWLIPQMERECSKKLLLMLKEVIDDREWKSAEIGVKKAVVEDFAKGFYDGAIVTIGERLRERFRGESTVLVISDQKAKEEFYGGRPPESSDYGFGIGEGRRHGEDAGKRLDLDPAHRVDRAGIRRELD